MVKRIKADVLVVGGGAGGTAAAIQAARRGAQTILVSEFDWLGGMLTSAGVTAPDGNELEALQTGIWGALLRELTVRQPGGLDNGWVSFFTYEPAIGAAIFADWVAALPNLELITGQLPIAVTKIADRVTGVTFPDYEITAQITIDGTELGDLLALGEIPHRWGWELKSDFAEPSAPLDWNALTARYPIQVPTWVVVLQDYGATAPVIPAPPNYRPALYAAAWANYPGEHGLNYGRLPGDRFMVNWPIQGNDYGEGVDRLRGSAADRQAFYQEALWHSLGFAHWIQTELGQSYGLAIGTFPWPPTHPYGLPSDMLSAFALHPYHREGRRLIGLTTVREQDLLPIGGSGRVAALGPDPIAMGNYVLDHHYPSGDIALAKKAMQWGGRWTGTPFTIPYRSLIPQTIDGFLACEKNISVTHLANGATRLQPVVLGIGQAAGMAAALCVEQQCQPRQLPVRSLQLALLDDPIAPAAVVPLLNQTPDDPQWRHWQAHYLAHPASYPNDGDAPIELPVTARSSIPLPTDAQTFQGQFERLAPQQYVLHQGDRNWSIVTLSAVVENQLAMYPNAQAITLHGQPNLAGNWIRVQQIAPGATAENA
jgi:hypothetical protein